MEELIKLVRTYRMMSGLADRLRLAEEIFRLIEPDLRLFVFSTVSVNVAEDALQEILKAVATSLKNFKGNTTKEFWGWAYRICRNKLNDQYRKEYSDRSYPIPPDELLKIIDSSAQATPLTAQNRLDLEYAMKLLTATKPGCSDLLWRHYVIGLDYTEIAEEQNSQYDAVRMKIGRCMDEAKSLVA